MFFTNQQSKAQKSAQIVLFSVLFFTGIGLVNETLIHEYLLKYLLFFATVISIIFVSLFLFFNKKHSVYNSELVPSDGKHQSWHGILGIIVIVPLFTYCAVARGIPVLFHYIASIDGEIVVTVKTKPNSYRTKHCLSGSVKVEEYKYFLNDRICGFNRSKWNSFNNQDEIVLKGKVSFIGFSF